MKKEEYEEREELLLLLQELYALDMPLLSMITEKYTLVGLRNVYEDTVWGVGGGKHQQTFSVLIRACCAALAVGKYRPTWNILHVNSINRFAWPDTSCSWENQTQYFLVLSQESSAKGMDLVAVFPDRTTRLQNCDYLIG